MALDDETAAYIWRVARSGIPPIEDLTPAEARAYGRRVVDVLGPGPDVSSSEDFVIAASDGSRFTVRVLMPDSTPRAVIIYYHGGGWMMGGLEQSDNLARKLCDESSCVIVVVDYRLAPESRAPAAADDSYAALEWVANNAHRLAGVGAPIVVLGDSSGGNFGHRHC